MWFTSKYLPYAGEECREGDEILWDGMEYTLQKVKQSSVYQGKAWRLWETNKGEFVTQEGTIYNVYRDPNGWTNLPEEPTQQDRCPRCGRPHPYTVGKDWKCWNCYFRYDHETGIGYTELPDVLKNT